MKIALITPGFGGAYYCGNCVRDTKYVHLLQSMDHQVFKIPIYMPLDFEANLSEEIPVFYGALSVYLKQSYPFFRKAPAWLDHLLNSKNAFKIAAKMSGSTNATGLEPLTISMLQGAQGNQQEELEQLIDWMDEHLKPDIVYLSNALLLGLAPRIKEKFNIPVVCSLQDEDTWVDSMRPAFRTETWTLLQKQAKYVDLFMAPSDYYVSFMKERLKLEDRKIKKIYLGIDPLEYHFIPADQKPSNIGFISRMSAENGLGILVDAFIEMHTLQNFNSETKLFLTGGYTNEDKKFLKLQKKKLLRAGLSDKVVFHKDFTLEGKKYFFDNISLLSVPVCKGEAFGLYLLEALASGTPVVQPALGSFPEIIETSGGGITYAPNQGKNLAKKLIQLLSNKERLHHLSISGRQAITETFNLHHLLSKTIQTYQQLLLDKKSNPNRPSLPKDKVCS